MSYLGIELGSTRIKGVIIDGERNVLASASHSWESTMVDGYWSYSLDEVWSGLRDVTAQLRDWMSDVQAMGVSAMMHGYLAFDADGVLLTPFRTWKNVNTAEAAAALSSLFKFNIPLRWSIAHLYQAILDNEPHTRDVAFVTTLAGYVHWQLTGERVLGVGDASGMFPIDGILPFRGGAGVGYTPRMVEQFREPTGVDITQIFPRILIAGESAGTVTAHGAELLGVPVGLPMCPPEGDAGTGMVATDSTEPRSGNVSAGTSVFAMTVLERPLSGYYPNIDIVTTPWALPVAMVHANECTSLIDPWIELFGEAARLLGAEFDDAELFTKLYESALGTGTLAAFMHGKLTDAVTELRDGLQILTERECVRIDYLTGHGGYFKSGKAGQRIMSDALGIPIRLLANASEGGAFGMAVLASLIGGNDNV